MDTVKLDKLYKYQAVNLYSISNLSNSVIYFSLEPTKDAIIKTINEMVEQTPLCCFSAKKDDPLMWGHYADGLRGFCIEFENKFSGAIPIEVNYDYFLPKAAEVYEAVLRTVISAQKNGTQSEDYKNKAKKWIEKVFCTKLKSWGYEEEWRIGHSQQELVQGRLERTMPCEQNISSIILGQRMSDVNKKLIKNIVHWKYRNNVKLQVARINGSGIEITEHL